MKIAYLANCQSPHTKRWVSYFRNAGHDVFIITSEPDSSLNIKQYKMRFGIPLPVGKSSSSFRYAISPLSVLYVKRILEKEKPDILHAHYISNYGFIGALSGFHPYVITAWGSDILINPKQYSGILACMVKTALSSADIITCDANHMVSVIKNLCNDESEIRLIYFGTDTRKFNTDKRSSDLRKKIGCYDNSNVVISVRNLELLYDVETFIRSIPIVLSKVPNTRFVVAGKGSQLDFLKSLAMSLNISDNVVFTGSIPFEEVPEYIASSDIYVSTALSDAGLAASTAEAMSCSLPVVITNFGDNKEWVKDGENGFLIPLKSPEMLAEKLIYLINNKDTREKFGIINRNIIESKLDYWKLMSDVEKIYTELIEMKIK